MGTASNDDLANILPPDYSLSTKNAGCIVQRSMVVDSLREVSEKLLQCSTMPILLRWVACNVRVGVITRIRMNTHNCVGGAQLRTGPTARAPLQVASRQYNF